MELLRSLPAMTRVDRWERRAEVHDVALIVLPMLRPLRFDDHLNAVVTRSVTSDARRRRRGQKATMAIMLAHAKHAAQ
jgi:hypothetical protein